jgi:4-amino-4-deoxy-L-arabinose transferase-like glycosyltransferase
VGEGGVVVVLLGFVFLLDLSWALAPEVQFDALAAHLPVAKVYVEHSIVLLPYGYVANLVNLLFALALSLQGQIVAKLLVFASSVLTTLSVYSFGRRYFSARVGLWAAALFFSTPLVIWLSSTAYVDAMVAMFLFSTLFAFFRWREDRQRGWLWATGLLTGAAIAAKMNAVLGLPVVGSLILWDLIRSHDPARERINALLGYSVGIVLVAAPGIAVAWALSGNPFYPLPLLEKVLKS